MKDKKMLIESIESQFSKLPPHSIESEMCLIGSMMLFGDDDAAHATTLTLVSRDAFYQADHQIIFDTICALRAEGGRVDAVLVREALVKKNLFEEIGGMEYLAALLNKVPSYAHYAHYAKIVAEKHKYRELIALGNETLRRAYAAELEPNEIAMKLSEDAAKIATEGSFNKIVHISDVLPDVLRTRHEAPTDIFPTGISSIDEMIGGFGFGKTHVIGALPGIGKSALLKKFLRTIGGAGLPIAIISSEEKRKKIAANMLSGESGIMNNRIQRGSASMEEWDCVETAAATLKGLPIFIVDSAYRLSEIVAMAHLAVAKHGCRAIFIDHVHIIDAECERGASRENEVSKISRTLKRTWSQLNVIGVQACQLNKASGKERPNSSNLRDSGTLFADADVIMLLHRPDYHYRDDPGYARTNLLEVIFDKNKDGSQAIVSLWYDESRFHIEDSIDGKPASMVNRVDAAVVNRAEDYYR